MRNSKLGTVLTVTVLAMVLSLSIVFAQGPNPRPTVWADCEVFKSVVPPQSFDNPHGPFDILYQNPNGFKDGYPLISESKPGDMDYNGGRWHMYVLKSGVSADKYSDACSVEDLDLNDFESTGNYFECPLQPQRGNRYGQ